MGFLDNSGDIILDAVLTDHGRKVLAKGDGTFQITKFALGDEEIDYSLYDTTNVNGSAYYDLEILQTPVLEAFTDNAVSMKSKLVTYESLELLYLPVIKLNETAGDTSRHQQSGSFIVAVDGLTEDDNGDTSTQNGVGFTNGNKVNGILFGQKVSQGSSFIRLDQGLDTLAISPAAADGLPADQRETEYMIQIDNRLGDIRNLQGGTVSLDYIDDDNIAYYSVSEEDGIVRNNTSTDSSDAQVVAGPRGTILEFKIGSSLSLQTSTYLFTQLGSTSVLANRAGAGSIVYHIDTLVRITGVNTGYTIDIPVRFVKFKST